MSPVFNLHEGAQIHLNVATLLGFDSDSTTDVAWVRLFSRLFRQEEEKDQEHSTFVLCFLNHDQAKVTSFF